MKVRVTVVAVIMRMIVRVVRFDEDEIHRTEPNAALGFHSLGEGPNLAYFAPEKYAFHAIAVIESDQMGRYNQIVMGMLHFGQALGQSARLPIIDIR